MLRYYRDSISEGDTIKAQLKLDNRNLDDHYDLKKKLGQGGQGAVYLAIDRATGSSRVLKFYDKNNANAPLDSIVGELKVLKSLDHPKIQRVYDVFQDNANIYISGEPY